jgi:hypothetical protein
MLKGAQNLGMHLASGTQKVMGAAESAKERAESVRDDMLERTEGVRTDIVDRVTDVKDDLRERYEQLLNTRNVAVLRLLRAFPSMRSKRYMHALRLLQKRLNVNYFPMSDEDTVEAVEFEEKTMEK